MKTRAGRAALGRQIWEREGGTAGVVGVPHGAPAAPDMFMIATGKVFRGAPACIGWPERDYPRYVQWYRDGKLPLDLLVSKRYTLDRVNEGCDGPVAHHGARRLTTIRSTASRQP